MPCVATGTARPRRRPTRPPWHRATRLRPPRPWAEPPDRTASVRSRGTHPDRAPRVEDALASRSYPAHALGGWTHPPIGSAGRSERAVGCTEEASGRGGTKVRATPSSLPFLRRPLRTDLPHRERSQGRSSQFACAATRQDAPSDRGRYGEGALRYRNICFWRGHWRRRRGQPLPVAVWRQHLCKPGPLPEHGRGAQLTWYG